MFVLCLTFSPFCSCCCLKIVACSVCLSYLQLFVYSRCRILPVPHLGLFCGRICGVLHCTTLAMHKSSFCELHTCSGPWKCFNGGEDVNREIRGMMRCSECKKRQRDRNNALNDRKRAIALKKQKQSKMNILQRLQQWEGRRHVTKIIFQFAYEWKPRATRKRLCENKLSPSEQLLTNGFVLLKEALNLRRDNQELMQLCQNMKKDEIFETITSNHGRVKTDPGCKKRFQTDANLANSRKIGSWCNIGKQIQALLKTNMGRLNEYTLSFTRLGSEPNTPAQGVHCDHADERRYGTSRAFSINAIIPISLMDDTFLDVRPLNHFVWERILLRRGDVFFFRGDVAHRGVEHLHPYPHYRIHCYCDLQAMGGRVTNTTHDVGIGFHHTLADYPNMRRGMIRALLKLN